MKRKWGQNKEEIIEYLIENPGATPRQISDATGIPRNLVYTLICRTKETDWRGYLLLNVSCQPKTYMWLRRTCPEGVSLADHIVSILVDAMNEETP